MYSKALLITEYIEAGNSKYAFYCLINPDVEPDLLVRAIVTGLGAEQGESAATNGSSTL